MSHSNNAVTDAQNGDATVTASVNEKRLFTSLKHLFAGSYSVLGELMQNARRAGATGIDFVFDPETRQLEIIDDGCGINDFSVLLSLCDSGWDEQTMLTDKPFGMGFFSVWYACQKVTLISNGRFIEATLDDIASRRSIPVQQAGGTWRGTQIVLQGLSDALMSTDYQKNHVILEKLKRYAQGFPIPVRVNGEELPRPHALDKLQTVVTELGHIHDTFVLGTGSVAHEFNRTYRHGNGAALYLQGLPIQFDNDDRADVIVHLDTQKFVPQMPDRHVLFDGAAQLEALQALHSQLVRQQLCVRKATMSAAEFVERYWAACERFHALELMNDIGVIPGSFLASVGSVAYRSEDTYDYHIDVSSRVVSRDEFLSGAVKAWRGSSPGFEEGGDPTNGVTLKIMQREGIFALERGDFHEDHWIFEVCPDVSEFDVKVTHTEPIDNRWVYVSGPEVNVVLVDSATVTITSRVDPEFRVEKVITDDWIPLTVIDNAKDRDTWTPVCLVMRADSSNDFAVDFYSGFLDESENYDEDYRDQIANEWGSAVNMMLGAGLFTLFNPRLEDARRSLVLGERNDGQMVLVYAARVDTRRHDLRAVDLENTEAWQSLAESIKLCTSLDAAALKAAFSEVFGVKAKID